LYLESLRRKPGERRQEPFPWSLPVFCDLERLDFEAPVTFLVGENGSGKSTLLEALAVGMGAVAMGARDLKSDETLAPARELASGFRFVRRRYPRARMFLRAEDAFGFTRRIVRERDEFAAEAERMEEELPTSLEGREKAIGLVAGQGRALARRYGDDPHARSHGETFLALLNARLVPRGLYFLDEPETPLSPTRVLALMAMLKERVAADCQFVIATHSPILMALPGARILVFEDGTIRPTPYEEVEHVRVTRGFLAHPDRYLREL
jgi:predicted ATPase